MLQTQGDMVKAQAESNGLLQQQIMRLSHRSGRIQREKQTLLDLVDKQKLSVDTLYFMVLNYMPETLLDAAGANMAERAKYVTADNVYRDFNKAYLNSLRAITLLQATWRAKKARQTAAEIAVKQGRAPVKPLSTYWDLLTVEKSTRKVKDAYNTGRMIHVHSPSAGTGKNIYDTIKHLTWIITHTERDVVKLMDFKTLFAALRVR
jgi:hypothetical protein